MSVFEEAEKAASDALKSKQLTQYEMAVIALLSSIATDLHQISRAAGSFVGDDDASAFLYTKGI